MQPVNLKDPEFINALKNLNADLFVVVAFRMLPEEVWKMPPLGTINLHASLLPDYRGAAPINHAIINGETTTGVTTFFIDEKIDTGNILLREEVQIFPFENAGDLHDRLMKLGARLVIRTLADIAENNIKALPQTRLINQGETLKLAPRSILKIVLLTGTMTPVKIHNLVRGLHLILVQDRGSKMIQQRFHLKYSKASRKLKNILSNPEQYFPMENII